MLTLKAPWRKTWDKCGTPVLIHPGAWEAVGRVHVVAVEINRVIKTNTEVPYEIKDILLHLTRICSCPFSGWWASSGAWQPKVSVSFTSSPIIASPQSEVLGRDLFTLLRIIFHGPSAWRTEICVVSPIVCSHSQSVSTSALFWLFRAGDQPVLVTWTSRGSWWLVNSSTAFRGFNTCWLQKKGANCCT